MNILVVGDVHGCYFTFKELLNKFWNPENDLLVQVGDLIDRGKFSPETVSLCRELKEMFPERTEFLKGNHEFEIIEHYYNGPNYNWLKQCGEETLRQYDNSNFSLKSDIEWFKELPLYWSNEKIFISHAGIAEECKNPFEEQNSQSVIWNRSELRNIEKLQIIGHTPCQGNQPFYDRKSNFWNIDTGSGYGGNLTALKLDEEGNLLEIIKLETLKEDI